MWRCNKNRKDCKLLFSSQDIIVFDTETSGLKPEKDVIIEIGAWKLRPNKGRLQILDSMDIFIKPKKKVSKKIEELTGLSNQFLSMQESEEEVFDSIVNFFGYSPIIGGYNVDFDVSFMKALYERHGFHFSPIVKADALEMARDLLPRNETDNFKLETILSVYGLKAGISFHRAIDDARGTARLFQALNEEYAHTPEVCGAAVPWISAVWYWEGYNHKQRSIYIRTNYGDIYYSFYNMGWESKENPDFYKEINMEILQEKLLARLSISSIEDLRKLKESDIKERESLYHQNRINKQKGA